MFQGLLGVFLASGLCQSPGGHVGMPCSEKMNPLNA